MVVVERKNVGLQTRKFSEAKDDLSRVMTSVVREHVPVVINRGHRNQERMVLLDLDLVPLMLGRFEFTTKASVGDGEFVLHQPEFNLVAVGETFEEAAEQLEELALDYVHQFFDRYEYFVQSGREDQVPYVLRLALAEPEDRRSLLIGSGPPRG